MTEPMKMRIDLSGLRERIAKLSYDKMIESHISKLETQEKVLKELNRDNQKEYNEKVSNLIMGTGQVPRIVGKMNSGDYASDYDFVSFKEIEKKDPIEYIEPSKIDYIIHNPNKEECKLKEDMPMSFMEIEEGDVERGKEWYLNKDPKLPDGIAELLARYNWGDLKTMPNNKQYKNAQKKAKRKGKDIMDSSLKVEVGDFVVKFD
jgi:hypothetical protein